MFKKPIVNTKTSTAI